MDHRQLLMKYMDHMVGHSWIDSKSEWKQAEVNFTEEEVEELYKIKTELFENWKEYYFKWTIEPTK